MVGSGGDKTSAWLTGDSTEGSWERGVLALLSAGETGPSDTHTSL